MHKRRDRAGQLRHINETKTTSKVYLKNIYSVHEGGRERENEDKQIKARKT